MEYNSYIDNAMPSNVIPAYVSVGEGALFTVAAAEESYKEMMKSIGIYELSLVIEGTEDKEKKATANIFVRFKEFVIGLVEKFKELVTKFHHNNKSNNTNCRSENLSL